MLFSKRFARSFLIACFVSLISSMTVAGVLVRNWDRIVPGATDEQSTTAAVLGSLVVMIVAWIASYIITWRRNIHLDEHAE